MKSRLTLALDASMVPVIKFTVSKDSDDLRDDVAKRFIEGIAFSSNLCTISRRDLNSVNPLESLYEIRAIKNENEIPESFALAGLRRSSEAKAPRDLYEELATKCGLKEQFPGNNKYFDSLGNEYHLTKYGFQLCIKL